MGMKPLVRTTDSRRVILDHVVVMLWFYVSEFDLYDFVERLGRWAQRTGPRSFAVRHPWLGFKCRLLFELIERRDDGDLVQVYAWLDLNGFELEREHQQRDGDVAMPWWLYSLDGARNFVPNAVILERGNKYLAEVAERVPGLIIDDVELVKSSIVAGMRRLAPGCRVDSDGIRSSFRYVESAVTRLVNPKIGCERSATALGDVTRYDRWVPADDCAVRQGASRIARQGQRRTVYARRRIRLCGPRARQLDLPRYDTHEIEDAVVLRAYCGATDAKTYEKEDREGWLQVRCEASTWNSKDKKRSRVLHVGNWSLAEAFQQVAAAMTRRYRGEGLKAMLLGESVEYRGREDGCKKLQQINAKHFAILLEAWGGVDVAQTRLDREAAWYGDLVDLAPILAPRLRQRFHRRHGRLLTRDFGDSGPTPFVRRGLVEKVKNGVYVMASQYLDEPATRHPRSRRAKDGGQTCPSA